VWVFKIGLVVEFIETWFLRSKVLGNFVFVFWSGIILGASFGKLSFHLVSESLNQFCFGGCQACRDIGQSWLSVIWRFGRLCFLVLVKK
jgi:hypothetical protein